MSDSDEITPIKVIFDLISEKRRLEDLVQTVYQNCEQPAYVRKAIESYLERANESLRTAR